MGRSAAMATVASGGGGAPALPRVGSMVDGRVRGVTGSGDVLLDIGGGTAAILGGGLSLGLVAGDDVSGLEVTGRTEAGVVLLSCDGCGDGGPDPAQTAPPSPRARGGSAQADSWRPPGGGGGPTYTREQLLRRRLPARAPESGGASITAADLRTPQEVEAELLRHVIRGELPPRGWGNAMRGRPEAHRRALLAAVRAGHMHVVFALQPESQQFRDSLGCFEPDGAFLLEAMELLCADAREAGAACPAAPPVGWLLERGAPAAPLLPAGRAAACVAGLGLLSALGPACGHALPEVLACAAHPDARVRRAAAEAAGSLAPRGGEGAGCPPALLALLLDPDPEVREAAAEAREGALPQLLLLLWDTQPAVREAAALALGRLGPAGLAAARALLEGEDGELRGLGLRALCAAGPAAAPWAGALAAWLQQGAEPAAALRAAAAQALGHMAGAAGPEAAAALAQCLLSDPDERVREAAAGALGGLGGLAAAHTGVLAGALDDADPFVRRAAAGALESLSGAAG